VYHVLSAVRPLLPLVLDSDPAMRATMRTTTAVTVLSAGARHRQRDRQSADGAAGIKSNVIPGSASAYINVRLLPTDSQARVLAHYTDVLSRELCAMPAAPVLRVWSNF
jgi:acetylornithine deacetylase/succinyl-diaminopimelate desuccinylase-like protein